MPAIIIPSLCLWTVSVISEIIALTEVVLGADDVAVVDGALPPTILMADNGTGGLERRTTSITEDLHASRLFVCLESVKFQLICLIHL